MNFFEAVGEGLKTLTYLDVYLGFIEYTLIASIPFFILSLFDKFQSKQVILLLVANKIFRTLGLVVVILSLYPIIFRLSPAIDWHYPIAVLEQQPLLFLKIFLVAFIFSLVIGFIPILGSSPVTQNLAIGVIPLIFITIQNFHIKSHQISDLLPSLLFIIGCIVITMILAVICIYILKDIFGSDTQTEASISETVVTTYVYAILTFFPIFVYGAWLYEKVKDVQ